MSDVYDARTSTSDDGWGPARAVRSAGGPTAPASTANPAAGRSAPARDRPSASPAAGARAFEPGRSAGGRSGLASLARLSALKGLLVLVAVTAAGCAVDVLRGQQLAGGFNIGIILGSVVAIVLVRRASMFPVVVAPPIVYSVVAGIFLYARTNGLSNKGRLLDAAANWLTYGFPAVAAATAAVLIIAGVRLLVRR